MNSKQIMLILMLLLPTHLWCMENNQLYEIYTLKQENDLSDDESQLQMKVYGSSDEECNSVAIDLEAFNYNDDELSPKLNYALICKNRQLLLNHEWLLAGGEDHKEHAQNEQISPQNLQLKRIHQRIDTINKAPTSLAVIGGFSLWFSVVSLIVSAVAFYNTH